MDLYTIIVCIYSCRDSSNSWDVSRDGLMIQLTSGGGSLQVGKAGMMIPIDDVEFLEEAAHRSGWVVPAGVSCDTSLC